MTGVCRCGGTLAHRLGRWVHVVWGPRICTGATVEHITMIGGAL